MCHRQTGRLRDRICSGQVRSYNGLIWFADVQQVVIERRLAMSARDYVGYLSTVSAYLQLAASEQEQVYKRIMRILPDQVEVAADITVHLARRRCER